MIVVPREGKRALLDVALRGLTLRLYVNLYTPVATSFSTSFQEPARETGYEPIALDLPALADMGDGIRAQFGEVTFPFTAAVSVVGFYVTDGAGDIRWAEQFVDGPYEIRRNGGEVVVQPVFPLA